MSENLLLSISIWPVKNEIAQDSHRKLMTNRFWGTQKQNPWVVAFPTPSILSLESDTLHRLRGFWQWQHHPFSALKAPTTWFLFGSLGGTPLKPIQVRSYRSNDSGCLWKEISSQVQHKWPVLSVFVISGWRIHKKIGHQLTHMFDLLLHSTIRCWGMWILSHSHVSFDSVYLPSSWLHWVSQRKWIASWLLPVAIKYQIGIKLLTCHISW